MNTFTTLHSCQYGISVHCDKNIRKARKRCSYCKGTICSRRVRFGVFTWRGDGRYFPEDARSIHVNESVAERKAVEYGPEFVVREVSA